MQYITQVKIQEIMKLDKLIQIRSKKFTERTKNNFNRDWDYFSFTTVLKFHCKMADFSKIAH